MTGFVVALMLIVGVPLLLGARSRIARLEYRLRLVEDEMRRRTEGATPPREVPASTAETLDEGEKPASATATEPVPEVEPEIRIPADVAESAPPSPTAVTAAFAEKAGPREPQAASKASEDPNGSVQGPAPIARAAISFEDVFGRRLPIWAGGITLAIAGVLIVRYAIDIGLFGRIFTPGVQATCGFLFGFGLIGGAEWAHRQRSKVNDPRVSQALSGAGVSTLYATLLVAANIYGLIPPLAAFFGLAAVTAGALWLSLRHGVPSALLGLAGGLAAPALTVGLHANVPMLAGYLGFTIAGLVGISRFQRWPWLAGLALTGGAVWSLGLILVGQALTVLGALSVGTFVILLAIAAPLFAFRDTGARLLRSLAAIVGAVQLALLVGIGGFQPLHWGLFALIAAAGQWLAWRERDFAIVPTLGAVLSFLLLMFWSDPSGPWLVAVGLSLGAIHALPLLARLWREPIRVQNAVELAGIAFAAPIVTLAHFPAGWSGANPSGALVATGGALLSMAGAALGWKASDRQDDARLAVLLSAAGALLSPAAWLTFPHGQAPLWIGAIAMALLLLSPRAGDWRIERIAGAFSGLSLLVLLATVPAGGAELLALVGWSAQSIDGISLMRWIGLAFIFALFALRAQQDVVRLPSAAAAALLFYGALAQVVPPVALPLVAPMACLALVGWRRTSDWPRLCTTAGVLATIILGWAFLPMAEWLDAALRSLGGVPMVVDAPDLAPFAVLRRLLAPALLLGGSIWLLRERLSNIALSATLAVAGALAIAATHSLYRAGFAATFGADFVTYGLAQRLVWCALLVGVAVVLWKRAGGMLASHAAPVLTGIAAWHVGWYSLVLHNPLWADQAVGHVPVANLLIPLFAALPACLVLIARIRPDHAKAIDRALQPLLMVMIAMASWATLRQAFHGSLLTEPGVIEFEDILRSILGIGLAIGFLLWGIRQRRHEWRIASLVLMLAAVGKVFLFDASGLEGLLRIASFVALGFSLIGIGWLYSRQLRLGSGGADEEPAE